MDDDAENKEPVKPDRGRGPSPKRSLIIAVVFAVVVVAWVASGVFVDDNPAPEAETATAAQTGATLVSVRVSDIAATERPRRIIVTGHTQVIKQASIKAEASGQVVAQPVRKGATVAKGTVLLELATNDRYARLKDAESQVEAKRLVFQASRDLQKKQFETEVKLANSSADLAAAEAALAAIRLEIANTKIKAPFDGYVETLEPNPGDFVTTGDMIGTVIDLDPLRVVVFVSERDIADVTVDDLATVTLPDGQAVGGSVQYVSRLANDATRTFRVDVWIDNPDGRIPAGQTAEVELHAGARKAHLVPSSVLTLNDQGVLGVRTVVEGDMVRFLPVTILDDTPQGTWISGLPEQARVITVGQEFVIDGQKVDPVLADAPTAAKASS